MDQADFDRVMSLVEDDMTPAQRLAVGALAEAANAKDAVQTALAVREARLEKDRTCPSCAKAALVRHGSDRNGLGRFRCLGCGGTCTALTGTPLARIFRRDLLVPFLEATLERKSLVRIADELGVCVPTVLAWRHLVLDMPATERKALLGGIVEADETFFLESRKGSKGPTPGHAARPSRHRGSGALLRGLSKEQVPVATALDREGGIVEAVLDGRSSVEIRRALAPSLEEHSVLCSDGLPAYKDLSALRRCVHRVVAPQHPSPAAKAAGLPRGRKGALGLGRVNSFHEALKTGINRIFRGVSTRFLANYAALERIVRQGVDSLGLLGRLLA